MKKINDILALFKIKTIKTKNLLISKCPVHDGDNVTAFNINIDPHSQYYGRWFCNTHGCNKEFRGDILGFIQAMLNKTGPTSFGDAIKFAEKLCGDTTSGNLIASDYLTEILARGKKEEEGITRAEVRSKLEIAPKFYIDRGFSHDILDEFDVGLCSRPDANMYNRVVFPVYNSAGTGMIGCVGRTVVNDPVKWKNQKGFSKSDYLYGYFKSLPYVCQNGTAILVEGQGDLIKLWMAGIKNVFGLFGSQLSATQELLLQKTGITEIIVFSDNDAAGEKLRADCNAKLRRLFNVKNIYPASHDAGDMSVEDLKELFANKKKVEYDSNHRTSW